MKKLFLLMIITCITAAVTAQLKVDLFMSATPPATLSEWGNRIEVLRAIITPVPGQPNDVKIKTEIKTMDGTVIGTTDLATAPVYNVGTTPLILTAVDVLPLDKMIFTGKYKSSLQRTGKLPADNYMLCVTLVRPIDLTPASNQACRTFYLAATQLPILMKPYHEEVLDEKLAQSAITFRWTPVVPKPQTPINYRIQVFEVLEHQTPVQALRANQPILDQMVVAATQFIWRPMMTFNDCKVVSLSGNQKNINTSEAVGTGKDGKAIIADANANACMFIWTIQTLDQQGNPITRTDGNGEGRSEPMFFYVKAKDKAMKRN